MSLRIRILGGFTVLIVLSLLQVGHLAWTLGAAGARSESFFSGPFTLADAARAAKLDFEKLNELASSVLAMTSPVDSKATLRTFDQIGQSLDGHLATMRASAAGESAAATEALSREIGTWRDHMRVLLGDRPADSIAAPHRIARLQRQIAVGLDRIVQAAVADAQASRAALQEGMDAGRRLAFVLALAGIGISAVAAWGLGRSITNPLKTLEVVMGALASGRTDVAIAFVDRPDEIGAMARSVEVFKKNAIERERLMDESEREQIERAARQRNTETAVVEFRQSVQDLLGLVAGDMEQMKVAMNDLNHVAQSTESRTVSAAGASEQSSANVQQVAAATSDMSEQIRQISVQIDETSRVIEKAAQAARDSDARVEALIRAADRIGQVVTLIQSIAEQTNLLALNATIEAARAGETGKGFAVVASEVKTLATQTAKATSDIAEQIEAIQSSSGDVVDAIRGITATMEQINAHAQSIASVITQQSGSMAEISTNVTQAAHGSRRVAEDIAAVNSSVAVYTRSAHDTDVACTNVSQRTDELREAVDRFLARVAAA